MRWVVGIDEVGRGALAGPVVVVAAALARGRAPRNGALGALRDSKKLTAPKREGWHAYLKELAKSGRSGGRRGATGGRRGPAPPPVVFAIARVYPRGIERRNISRAANLAAMRAFGRLEKSLRLGRGTPVFLDGGLFLGNGAVRRGKTIIKGDEKIAAVKVASIVAKVRRDGMMRRLSRKWPAYGFDVHKGYGTASHMGALKLHGPCPAHRLTFMGKSAIMDKT